MNYDELISKIRAANTAYANGLPFMTDYEYDKLWKQLYYIAPTNSLLYHTARNPMLSEGLINHSRQVFGTNKAFNIMDLKPFIERFGSEELIIEPKYDGCAGVLSFSKKGLQLVLEGDGISGLDITRHLSKLTYNFEPKNFETVEIIIPWAKWNPDYGANPRNVIAGWLNRKEFPDHYAELVSHNYGSLFHKFYFESFELLDELLLSLYYKWSKIYPIDGLLIKVSDEHRRLVASHTNTTYNWSIAWKPPIQVKETKVVDIEWNVSRLGRVVPTVVYEPIELCSTMNTRVTGNNARWILDRQISIGSTIIVGKSGEIIPKIIDVIHDDLVKACPEKVSQGVCLEKKPTQRVSRSVSRGFDQPTGGSPQNTNGRQNENLSVPTVCPKCNYPLKWVGVHLICNGPQCVGQLIKRLKYFYSESGIYIHDLGEKRMEKLLYDPECYVVLSEKPWALLDPVTYDLYFRMLEVLGSTITEKIYNNIQKLKSKKDGAHFIAGMGIEGVGYKTAYKLFNYLKTGKLQGNISKKAQGNFTSGLISFYQAQEEMKNFDFCPVPEPAKVVYCITGTLSVPRSEFISYLSMYQWEWSKDVTTYIDFLIVGDSPGKTKLFKAKKYGKHLLNENDLTELLTLEDKKRPENKK